MLEGLTFGSHDGEGRTRVATEEARSIGLRPGPCIAKAQMRKCQLGRFALVGRGGHGRRHMCLDHWA